MRSTPAHTQAVGDATAPASVTLRIASAHARDRGPHRSIHRALYNLPTWEALSTNARFSLIALKTLLGPAGIEKMGPAALVESLSLVTALDANATRLALDEIERAGSLRRGPAVVWVVEQLDWEPSMVSNNPKHRTAVQRHLATIPCGDVLDAFRARYAQWLEGTAADTVGDTPSDTLCDTLCDTLSDRVSDTLCDTPRPRPRPNTETTTVPALPEHQSIDAPANGTAATREERGNGTEKKPHTVPPSGAAKGKASELSAWLDPIRAAFEVHGAAWYAKPDEQLIALYRRGIPAERVVRAARVMFAAPKLHSPSPKTLAREWTRWDGEATAAERWDIYKREGLTDAISIDIDAAVARVVARGESPSADAFRTELQAVRPWSISLDRDGTLREVAKRLAAA